jgi:Ner family transcriptional regulator
MMEKKKDWHQADIIAALRKKGTTLAALSRRAGLSSSTLANALSRPWPKGEWIIANALKIHPANIWPSRYYDPFTNQLLERKARSLDGSSRLVTQAFSNEPRE